MRRIQRALLLMLAAALFLLSACGKNNAVTSSSAPAGAPQEAQAAAGPRDTITVMAAQGWIDDAEIALGERFEERSGIHVVYEIVPADRYQELLAERIEAGTLPDVFCAWAGPDLEETCHVTATAADLSGESWVQTYRQSALAQTAVNGVNFGMLYADTSESWYLIYNRKLLSQAGFSGVPSDFEQFEKLCEALLKNDVVPICEPCADGWHQVLLFDTFTQSLVLKDPGLPERLSLDMETFASNEELKTALGQLAALARKGCFGEDFASCEYQDAADLLASGKYAMCMLRPGSIADIVSSEKNTAGFTEEDFAFTVLPLCSQQILNLQSSGPAHFVTAGGSHLQEAKDYLAFLAQKDSLQYMIDTSNAVGDLPFEAGQTPDTPERVQSFQLSFPENAHTFGDTVTGLELQCFETGANMTALLLGDMTPEDVLLAIDEGRAPDAEESP